MLKSTTSFPSLHLNIFPTAHTREKKTRVNFPQTRHKKRRRCEKLNERREAHRTYCWMSKISNIIIFSLSNKERERGEKIKQFQRFWMGRKKNIYIKYKNNVHLMTALSFTHKKVTFQVSKPKQKHSPVQEWQWQNSSKLLWYDDERWTPCMAVINVNNRRSHPDCYQHIGIKTENLFS